MANDSTDEKLSEEMIDATLADSFPASDPPSWTLGREKRSRSTRHANQPKRKQGQKPGYWPGTAYYTLGAITIIVAAAIIASIIRAHTRESSGLESEFRGDR
jgi:hypothetical protein